MNIQTRAAQATKNRRGVMMAPLLVAVTVAAIVVIPIVRWCMAFINGTENINAQLEMKSIIQDYYARISAASYEDMQETIAAKGTTWTEDVGGRYMLKVETSEAGKFENALCNLDEAAGAYDRACMKANITLVSKADPSRTVGMQVTRVATLNQLAELADKIEAEGERFADYYTKAEADAQYACPWDYHLVSGKCVACPAPSNWKQYRSGNCTLGTCSTGYKANAAKTGCTKITCPSGQVLNGDNCVVPCADGKELDDTGKCVDKVTYRNIFGCMFGNNYNKPTGRFYYSSWSCPNGCEQHTGYFEVMGTQANYNPPFGIRASVNDAVCLVGEYTGNSTSLYQAKVSLFLFENTSIQGLKDYARIFKNGIDKNSPYIANLLKYNNGRKHIGSLREDRVDITVMHRFLGSSYIDTYETALKPCVYDSSSNLSCRTILENEYLIMR